MQVRGGERLSVRRAPEGAQTRQLLPQPRLHAAQEAPGTGSFICSETRGGFLKNVGPRFTPNLNKKFK